MQSDRVSDWSWSSRRSVGSLNGTLTTHVTIVKEPAVFRQLFSLFTADSMCGLQFGGAFGPGSAAGENVRSIQGEEDGREPVCTLSCAANRLAGWTPDLIWHLPSPHFTLTSTWI